ncbi:MAG: hypothetical protein ACRED4_04650 [Brevundimonas sp.]
MSKTPAAKNVEIPSRRPRIFALLGNRARLQPTSGDQINEARFLAALSSFADVYYNGQLFRPELSGWGLDATVIATPAKDYDLYYVRNNTQIFAACPSPKVAMAYPFDPVVFREADALFVTTAAWKWGLEPYSPTNRYSRPLEGWYGRMSMKLPKLINIKQVLDEHFLTPPVPRDVTEARARMTFGRIVGFFGRIESNTYPTILTAAYQDLKKLLPDLQLVVAGTLRIPLPADVMLAPRIDYEKMPQFVKACIATASDEGDDAEFLGSGKVLDSVAAGVPIIAYKTPPRVEQLGEDYPLYYRDHAGAAKRLMQAAFDRELMADVRKHLAVRSVMFSPATRALELKVEIETLLQEAASAT